MYPPKIDPYFFWRWVRTLLGGTIKFFFIPLAGGTFIAGGTIFCGFFVICRGHLSGEGRYVFEYYKCHRYDIEYSMMKSLPVVGIFIKEIMIFGIISNVL